ncbi:HAD-IB family hydrolase, partial [Candidatus Saccharibacteria bacterium]|nr:HAD-IB family hydrolase [Candidatus Saccharibacteria bacterium]
YLTKLIDKHGLSTEKSLAVGDTKSDIKMLEMVEQPICFNPSQELYDEARKRGWKIVIERKDVIYELTPEAGVFKLK